MGLVVTTADNQTMTVSNIIETGRIDATFNLTVADFETYFVGENKVLVHNCTKVRGNGTRPIDQPTDLKEDLAGQQIVGDMKSKNSNIDDITDKMNDSR